MALWLQCSKYLFGFPEMVVLLIPAGIVLEFGKDGLGAGVLLFPASLLLHYEQQLLFSCSVVSDSLQPHGLQHTRLPCPPEFAQTHVHRVSDVIQPSHPLSSLSPPALNLFWHQGLFQ